MRGRRGPELAAGRWRTVLEEASGLAVSEVLAFTAELSPEQRVSLLSDWDAGRAHLIKYIHLKFAHWECLPYAAVALGHPDPDVARPILRRSLMMYDASELAHRHPLSESLLSAQGQHREELLSFLAGTDLQGLPSLHILAGKMALTTLVESSIEGKHALIARGIQHASNISCPFVSWTCREPLLQKMMSRPKFLEELSLCCMMARSPLQAVASLGLGDYPQITECLSRKGKVDCRNTKTTKQEYIINM